MLVSQDELFAAIGKALHEWSLVEMDMASLFASLGSLGSNQDNDHQLFAAVISFETRLSMLDTRVPQSLLGQTEQKMWVKFSSRLSKQYKKRHQVAHFTLGRAQQDYIALPFLTTATIRNPTIPRLTVSQIKERTEGFKELKRVLEWFRQTNILEKDRAFMRWSGRSAPLQRNTPEPPYVSRIRESVAQIQERS